MEIFAISSPTRKNIMKFVKSGLMLLSIIVLLSGCTSTEKARKKKKIRVTPGEYFKAIKADLSTFSPSQAAEAKKMATFHADNFYKGLKNKDYALFRKTKNWGKKNFDGLCKDVAKNYGKLESQNYVGVKNEPLIMRFMWKWSFKNKIMKETFTRDILFNVFIIKYKNKEKCSLYFIGFK